jgi:peptidylprolyl isomerase
VPTVYAARPRRASARHSLTARAVVGGVAIAVVAGLSGCGSTAAPSTSTPSSVAASTSTSSAAPASTAATGPLGSAPDLAVLAGVTVSGGGPSLAPNVTWTASPLTVTSTTRTILTAGSGPVSTLGSVVTANLALFKGSDGSRLDSTFESGSPQPLELDPTKTVPGFVAGLLGLSPGTRALIVIPPKDAYGTAGRPEIGISPTENLVLLADIVSVTTPLKHAEGTEVAPVAGLPTVTFDPKTGPTITVPTALAAPTTMVSQLLIDGTGATIKAGDLVRVHYTGVLWKDGSVFDSSWTRGTAFSFQVGTGSVIKAWDAGFIGKKAGSRVLLVVPPADGYGAAGSPPKISGTDTLVFVVDILAVS